jgi:predicted metalloprotease with PDZ domain
VIVYVADGLVYLFAMHFIARRSSSAVVALVALTLALAIPERARAASQDPGAPEPVLYRLRMPDPASHLFEVEVTAATAGEPVEFQLPAWSPGRYVIYDFAVNVQNARATDAEGHALVVEKTDKQTWRVTPRASGRVTFAYQMFADNLSGTFSQLDERHANYNGASLFVYVVGRKPAPVHLEIEPPPNWRVVNGATTAADQRRFEFANYDLLIDTPTEIAPDFEVSTFREGSCEYRVVTHQLGAPRGDAARYAADVQKIVRAENAVMGVPPDLPRYTFLVHFAPGNDGGDGMEHLASTQIVRTRALGETASYGGALSVTAHEFFHLWNVKRLRPAELGPWDYTRENYTTSLWIAEGITSYYGDLSLERAGFVDEPEFLRMMAGEIAGLQSRPGRLLMSAERSSFDTWLYLATRPLQRTRGSATAIDYYNKGEILGLLLDLEIRGRTGNAKSLDDVMRLMYRRFFLDAPAESYYYKGRGYHAADFLAAVNEVSGARFDDWFAKYVSGTEELDYGHALAFAGLRLDVKAAGAAESAAEPAGYAILDAPTVTPEQRSLRRAWLAGAAVKGAGAR